MKTIRRMLFLAIFSLIGIGASAQFLTPTSGGIFSLTLSGAMPRGDFAKQESTYAFNNILLNKNGNAAFGASIGFKAGYQFDFGMNIFVGIEGTWNQLNKDLREIYDNSSKTKPNYINVPIMIGLGYNCYFGNVFGLYAEAGAGASLLYITPEGWSDNLTEYRLSADFGYEFGGGILLGEHISLGIHYYNLGKQKIEIADPTLSSLTKMQSVNFLKFRLGLTF